MYPSDVITAIFVCASKKAEWGRDGRCVFQASNSDLQRCFWSLQNKKKYKILDRFVFGDSGPEPYSPVLGGALFASLNLYEIDNAFVMDNSMRSGYTNDIRITLAELNEISSIADKVLETIPHHLQPW